MSEPTTAEMLIALRETHRNLPYRESWAFFDELRVGTGFGHGSEQSMDAFAIALWPSKHWASHAYEIKTSRADFTRELRTPVKRRPALRYSNLFWFVTPEGLVKPEEVPIEAGLIEVRWRGGGYPRREDWFTDIVLQAPWRDIPPPTWNLFASVARRVHRLENGHGES
ncbi:hypothetical protein LCGC14_2370020 [marine sediment metagenome]|uniref:Uncharacterized protein n=1 Tax=marine sediment metagenome TaxID=412755 RepID=A0A0F9C3Y9_9ZZZZ